MEIALRRLDGVDKISISISEQRFQVTYKSGASFHPRDIRDAVGKAGVEWCGSELLPGGGFTKKQASSSWWQARISFSWWLLLECPPKARSRLRGPSMIPPGLSNCK